MRFHLGLGVIVTGPSRDLNRKAVAILRKDYAMTCVAMEFPQTDRIDMTPQMRTLLVALTKAIVDVTLPDRGTLLKTVLGQDL